MAGSTMAKDSRAMARATLSIGSDELARLDSYFAASKPLSRGHEAWQVENEPSFIAVMDGSWDGLATAKGAKFKAALIVAACSEAWACQAHRALPKSCLDALSSAIGKLGLELGEDKAMACFVKCANKFAQQCSVVLGYCGHGERGSVGIQVAARALARAGGAQVALRLARGVLPPWQLAQPSAKLRDAPALVAIYSDLFESGVDLQSLWGLEPRPGSSMAEQAQARIDKMGPGVLRGFFESKSQFKELAAVVLGASEAPIDAWLAPGLSASDGERLAGMVGMLEERHPGLGAQMALEWMAGHPDIAAALAAKAPKAPAPSRKARL